MEVDVRTQVETKILGLLVSLNSWKGKCTMYTCLSSVKKIEGYNIFTYIIPRIYIYNSLYIYCICRTFFLWLHKMIDVVVWYSNLTKRLFLIEQYSRSAHLTGVFNERWFLDAEQTTSEGIPDWCELLCCWNHLPLSQREHPKMACCVSKGGHSKRIGENFFFFNVEKIILNERLLYRYVYIDVLFLVDLCTVSYTFIQLYITDFQTSL